jgi:hypothetical protein
MLAIDVKDAFLTVEQEQPTRVRCTGANGTAISYALAELCQVNVMVAFSGTRIW